MPESPAPPNGMANLNRESIAGGGCTGNAAAALRLRFQVCIDEERQFCAHHGALRGRGASVENIYAAWILRFLPVGLGPAKLWYARTGHHWLNKRSIICPRCVSPDFGGDQQAECPICELADALYADGNESVSNFGHNLEAKLSYLTYCLVYMTDADREGCVERSKSKAGRPCEFSLDPESFFQLMDYFLRGTTADRPLSVLDMKIGNDFLVTRTSAGIRLRPRDPSAVFDRTDRHREQLLNQARGRISQRTLSIPTAWQFKMFVRMAERAASDIKSCGRGDSMSPKLNAERQLR